MIELPCAGCGQRLQVRDQDAGKQARCPQCGQLTQIPLGSASLPPQAAPPPPSGQPTNPYAMPPADVGPQAPLGWAPGQQYMKPHRGTLILVLGIFSAIGFFCCLTWPCGPIAWILGSNDLKAMRSGRMDPSGERLTRGGMIVGIIGTVLVVGWLAVSFGFQFIR